MPHFGDGDRSAQGSEGRGDVKGRRRASCSWWQERLEVFFSREVMIRCFLFGKEIHVTTFLSVTVSVFSNG